MPRGPRAPHDLYSPERPHGRGPERHRRRRRLSRRRAAGAARGRGQGRPGGRARRRRRSARCCRPSMARRAVGAARASGGGRRWRRAYRLAWRYRAIGLGAAVDRGRAGPARCCCSPPPRWSGRSRSARPARPRLGSGRRCAATPTLVSWAYAPRALPTWVPRARAALAGGLAGRWPLRPRGRRGCAPRGGTPAARCGACSARRSTRGRSPALATGALWDLLRGGAKLARPRADDSASATRNCWPTNLGQPGYRDLLLAVHDLDARRDLVFGLLGGEAGARQFPARRDRRPRRAEAFDLARPTPAACWWTSCSAAATLPAAVRAARLRFPAEGYWRGEVHRACDRPAALTRLLEEARPPASSRCSSSPRRPSRPARTS